MDESCPVLTPAERQVNEILSRTEEALFATVRKAIEDARNQAGEELQAIGSREMLPAYDYFAAVMHQKLFLMLCGADPDTFEGGNPEIAARLLDNGRNISTHYWAGKDPAKSAN